MASTRNNPGPADYPVRTLISRTADMRISATRTRTTGGSAAKGRADQEQVSRMVDGVPEVLAAARDNLRSCGASQVKLVAVAVLVTIDPIQSTQFHLRRAQGCRGRGRGLWDLCHSSCLPAQSINRAIDAGVKVIEHGQLLDEATLERMANDGIWLSTQPFTVANEPQLSASSNAKLAVAARARSSCRDDQEVPEPGCAYGTDISTMLRPSARRFNGWPGS